MSAAASYRYAPDVPWPCMRGDFRNTGRAGQREIPPAPVKARGVRRFVTGKSIFSTPVIGADETIYVGSADTRFYALDPLSGRERWRFTTGEAIDCAACLTSGDRVFVPSCDGALYALSLAGEQIWKLDLLQERRRASLSTIYWWEANVALGPSGLLFAGCDDFYLYAIDPEDGSVRWTGQTGLQIWTAPAFGPRRVYVASFDTCVYAYVQDTGELIWKTPTGNFVASSPAVGADGGVYFGSFDGRLYCLDDEHGAIAWTYDTQAPIYASPAIGPDGLLLVGSSSGLFYAISPETRSPVWTFTTGDPIRASAAVGPDPEGRAAYLVYLGGGNGIVYALDPEGRRRWSFDTRTLNPGADYPNINASIALGHYGLATATANGDVVWIPYREYLEHGDEGQEDEGWSRRADDGFPREGRHWYFVSPGGAPEERPLAGAEQRTVGGAQTLSVRLVARERGQTVPARIDAEGLRVAVEPPLAHRVAIQPDGQELSVIPDELPSPGTELRITVGCAEEGQQEPAEQGTLDCRVAAPAQQLAGAALADHPFAVTQMAVYAPPIVPSFDQIGIASLTLDVRVLRHDGESGAVVAWGVKTFGFSEEGQQVGVPSPRSLFYAFAGQYRDGTLLLEARDCQFELTAFPVPLDRFRLTGTIGDDSVPDGHACLVAEYRLRKPLEILGGLVSRLRRGGLDRPSSGGAKRQLLPKGTQLSDLPQLLKGAALMLPVGPRLLRGMHRPWGLFDAEGRFTGVGTFRARPLTARRSDVGGILVEGARHDSARGVVEATLRYSDARQAARMVPGILLVDRATGRPVICDYNQHLATEEVTAVGAGKVLRTTMTLPERAAAESTRLEAIVLANVTPLTTLELG